MKERRKKYRNGEISKAYCIISKENRKMAMAKSAKANNNGVIMAMASNSENRIGENDQ
jgi:hypothetical protein